MRQHHSPATPESLREGRNLWIVRTDSDCEAYSFERLFQAQGSSKQCTSHKTPNCSICVRCFNKNAFFMLDIQRNREKWRHEGSDSQWDCIRSYTIRRHYLRSWGFRCIMRSALCETLTRFRGPQVFGPWTVWRGQTPCQQAPIFWCPTPGDAQIFMRRPGKGEKSGRRKLKL